MYLSKGRTFQFWLTVYTGPALVPLILQVMFEFLVRKDLVAALGVKGSTLGGSMSISLSLSFIVLIVLANAAAFWHQWRQLPLVPEERARN